MTNVPSRWTMPLLRVSMGVFLALWGVDKLVAREGAERIFARFYHVEIGTSVLTAAGVLQVLLGACLTLGLLRIPTAWAALSLNVVSTLASWRQILDPWGHLGLGPGGTHLFLASIVLTAVSVVLVLNARDATFTLDARLGITHPVAPPPGVMNPGR